MKTKTLLKIIAVSEVVRMAMAVNQEVLLWRETQKSEQEKSDLIEAMKQTDAEVSDVIVKSLNDLEYLKEFRSERFEDGKEGCSLRLSSDSF